MNNNFNKEIWLDGWLDENNLIKIPENVKRIRIDVGLAGDAPNSALWLNESDDLFVIGIEPQQFMWDHLNILGTPNNTIDTIIHPMWHIIQLGKNSITLNKQVVKELNNNFLPIKVAINEVSNPTTQDFYVNVEYESGSSSLRYPQERPHLLKEVVNTNVCSLEYVLNHIPWDRFNYIEHIKTDCEGMDFEVIKSIGKYIDKVVFVTSELSDFVKDKNNEFINWMLSNSFTNIGISQGNINFINQKFNEEVKLHNITNKTLGL
jgi:hypothetical protein